jgi:hypothetical protein
MAMSPTGMSSYPVAPTAPSNLYYPQIPYGYGPPYFQDPFLSSGQCPPFLVIPPTTVAGNVPPSYFTPRVTSPVPEDDTSTIVTNGVPASIPQDIVSHGGQVSFHQAMLANASSVPQVSAGCQVLSFSTSSRS